MSILEFQKEQLRLRIGEIDDEKLLQKIMDLVNEEQVVYVLTEEQKRGIEKGRQEIAEGKGISNEEVKRRTRQFLKLSDTKLKASVYKLSDVQRASIQRGLDDIKAGRVKSDEEFQKELDEWLGKGKPLNKKLKKRLE